MSLHEQIEAELLRCIQTGKWPVGSRLPPEQELAASLGISRATLRTAYSRLENQGILQRRKRAGTTVLACQPTHVFKQRTGGLHSVLDLADSTRLDIISMEDIADGTVDELGMHKSATGYWLAVTGQRSMTNSADAFAWTKMYINGKYSGIRPLLGQELNQELNQELRSLYSVIESTFDITVNRLVQAVTAAACPVDAAAVLGLEPGAPSLHIVAQLLTGDDEVVEVTSTYFHPEKFQVRSDVSILC